MGEGDDVIAYTELPTHALADQLKRGWIQCCIIKLDSTLSSTIIRPFSKFVTLIKDSIMAPAAIDPRIVDVAEPRKETLPLPPNARERLEKAGIDLSAGYPYRPARPLYVDDVYNIRNYDRPHIDPGSRADPEKKALLSAAKEVIHLTKHIGTEIVGLQLKDLNDKQKDELGLLIAERSVVFFRDQDISPQQQKELGEWFGEVEIHVCRCIISAKLLGHWTNPCSAASTTGSWSARCDRIVAGPAGSRNPGCIPPAWRCFPLAYRSCA
jgi:hypothetical protein